MTTGAATNQVQYRDQVLRQPGILREMGPRLASDPVLHDWVGRWRHRGRPPVLLTGMGASLYAAEAAAVILARAGRSARALPISDLLDYEFDALPQETAHVVISQSGESAELSGLLERLPPDEMLAVTNRQDSRLGRHAARTVLLGAPRDETVALGTYTGSLAFALILAAELTGEGGEAAARQITAAAGRIRERLAEWEERVEDVAEMLADKRSLFILGWGWGVASAREAALLMKEGARRSAEAMGAASFRHGSVEAIDRDSAVVFFLNDPGDPKREDAWAYVGELLDLACDVVVIGPDAPADLAPSKLRSVRSGDGLPASALCDIVPVQLLAAELARRSGFEAGTFRNTSPVVSTMPVRSQ